MTPEERFERIERNLEALTTISLQQAERMSEFEFRKFRMEKFESRMEQFELAMEKLLSSQEQLLTAQVVLADQQERTNAKLAEQQARTDAKLAELSEDIQLLIRVVDGIIHKPPQP